MDNIEHIFEKYQNTKDEIEMTIGQLKKLLSPYNHKIVLYGAGSAGIAFYHYLKDAGINVLCFADGDTEKHGTICEGLEVLPPQTLVQTWGHNILVIVTINTDGMHYCRDFKKVLLQGGHKGVHQNLKDAGCRNVVDYTYFQRVFELYKGGNYNLPCCADVNLMFQHKDDIIDTYKLLEDDLSKQIFTKLLEYRMLLEDAEIPTISEEKQYFEWELFPKMEDEVFIDCGACGGSSLKIFLEESDGIFSEYYGLEPDKNNYSLLESYIDKLEPSYKKKMHIFHKAAFDKIGTTAFFELGGPGSFASINGPNIVETTTIDAVLSGKRATYIKMNIEGSEIPALKGGKYTITTFKPRLAIMGYHKTSDFWEVPLLIKRYRPDYKIALRSYMKNVAFCYYAY